MSAVSDLDSALYHAVDSLPKISDVILESNLRATKALGQNFLCDLNMTRKIARAADIQPDDHIIEIGPGPGGLTRGLFLEGAQQVTAIEFDPRAVNALQSLIQATNNALSVIEGDALQENLLRFGEDGRRKIVANLPYNISVPLIIQWLKHVHHDAQNAYCSITIMVQKEVAERISATFDTSHYGRLSVLCQWLCHCDIQFHVPPSAFVPPPKVTSSIIQLTPRQDRQDDVPFATIEKLTEMAFGQRRKMIRQSLKPYLPILHDLGLNETDRGQSLSVKNYVDIARALT